MSNSSAYFEQLCYNCCIFWTSWEWGGCQEILSWMTDKESVLGLDSFPTDVLIKELFLKFNSAIPSSAAVERFISVGKDIMEPKRAF